MKITFQKQINREELESLAFDIGYVMIQCSAFIVWELMHHHQTNLGNDRNENLFRNSLLESHLLFIRKLNAFFNSKKDCRREKDDVYAFDFPGFDNVGWFLEKHEVDELSLRVGPIMIGT
jgi:hypothetical protein